MSKHITDKCRTKFRYNLQIIKCTVCIVQDKVVKVVKLSGPVRLWDLKSGRLLVWEWFCLLQHFLPTHSLTRHHPWRLSSHHLQNREHEIITINRTIKVTRINFQGYSSSRPTESAAGEPTSFLFTKTSEVQTKQSDLKAGKWTPVPQASYSPLGARRGGKGRGGCGCCTADLTKKSS